MYPLRRLVVVFGLLLLAVFAPRADFAEAAALSFPPGFDDEFDDEGDEDLADFQREVASELAAFRDERDRDFAEFLEEQWKEFEAFAGEISPRIPGPDKIPVATPKPIDSVPPGGKKIEPPPPPKPKPAPAPEPEPNLPPKSEPIPVPKPEPAAVPKPEPPAPAGKPGHLRADFEFHGLAVQIYLDPDLLVPLTNPVDNQAISEFWKSVSQADFPPLVEQLQQQRGRLRLNDWGYYQLIHALADKVQASANDATLFTWFLLTKSGYRTKVGYGDGRVCLLVPAAHLIYSVPFVTLEGAKYYNLTTLRSAEKAGRLYTYQEHYPGADRLVNLDLREVPLLGTEPGQRQLFFRYGGKTFTIPLTYDRTVVSFLDSYPQTDLPVFFPPPVAAETERSLLAGLGPIIAGKSETEAVNILLRFVQTAFEYQTDDEQFGREKYFFAEEILHYPFSDCEDRSVLFGFLVRRLTGLEVVGLLYPGHVATAVRFTGEAKGDKVAVDGKTFVVCDPTYINADIGMAMPQFKGATPEIISIGM